MTNDDGMTARTTHALSTILALAVLSGCATAPQIGPIRSGESVAIVLTRGPAPEAALKIRNQALGDNVSAGAGAGTGMVAGGLWGLTCGPLAILCVPLGAMTGAVTGTAAAAVVGVTGELSSETAVQLRDRLARFQQSHDLVEELRSNVTGRARRHWTIVEASGSVVTIELQNIALTSTRDEQTSFTLRAWSL